MVVEVWWRCGGSGGVVEVWWEWWCGGSVGVVVVGEKWRCGGRGGGVWGVGWWLRGCGVVGVVMGVGMVGW